MPYKNLEERRKSQQKYELTSREERSRAIEVIININEILETFGFSMEYVINTLFYNLNKKFIKAVLSPLHQGTGIKDHFHLSCYNRTQLTLNQWTDLLLSVLLKITSFDKNDDTKLIGIPCPIFTGRTFSEAIRYGLHWNDDSKTQYDINDCVASKSCDLFKSVKFTHVEIEEYYSQIHEIIIEKGFTKTKELEDYISNNAVYKYVYSLLSNSKRLIQLISEQKQVSDEIQRRSELEEHNRRAEERHQELLAALGVNHLNIQQKDKTVCQTSLQSRKEEREKYYNKIFSTQPTQEDIERTFYEHYL